MSSTPATPIPVPRPIWPIWFVADLGGLALLLVRALAAPFQGRQGTASLIRGTLANAGWMMGMSFPLVALVHMSIGSFLAMQAYYGATYTEATGIVVGLGLIRNVAPILTGFILAGLLGVKITSELKGGPRPGLDDFDSLPDREVERGIRPDTRPIPSIGRIALPRLLAAALVGPVLSLWGSVVGSLMGLIVAKSMLGQSPAIFLGKMTEMLTPIDVIGLMVKGVGFCGSAALFATFEGLRPESRGGPDAYRAVVRSVFVILIMNLTWFDLMYLAGNPFGPNVVTPR